MHDWLTGVVMALGVVVLLVLLVLLARDVVAQDRTFALIGGFEVVLLAEAVVGFVALATTSKDVTGVLFGAYLVGQLFALPVGVFWSLAERTRYGTGVLVVAVLTVLALQARLLSIWNGAHA